jgi:hypothetical protein
MLVFIACSSVEQTRRWITPIVCAELEEEIKGVGTKQQEALRWRQSATYSLRERIKIDGHKKITKDINIETGG